MDSIDVIADAISIHAVNMAREMYGLETRLSNENLTEIKNETIKYLEHYFEEYKKEVRLQILDDIEQRMHKALENIPCPHDWCIQPYLDVNCNQCLLTYHIAKLKEETDE